MTKEEIKEMILGITKENTTERLHAEILNAIVDNMGGEWLLADINPSTGENLSLSGVASRLGVSTDDVRKLCKGKYEGVIWRSSDSDYDSRLKLVFSEYPSDGEEGRYSCILGITDETSCGVRVSFAGHTDRSDADFIYAEV